MPELKVLILRWTYQPTEELKIGNKSYTITWVNEFTNDNWTSNG